MRFLFLFLFFATATASVPVVTTADCPSCTRCKGSGEIIVRCRPIFPDCEPGPYPCPNCEGSGKICPKASVRQPEQPVQQQPPCICKACKGRGGRVWGRVPEAEFVECNTCGGDGKCH